MISKDIAMQIAGDWHGGQNTELYSLASSGQIRNADWLLAEIRRIDATPSQRNRLKDLADYVTANQPGPIPLHRAIVLCTQGIGMPRLIAVYCVTGPGTDRTWFARFLDTSMPGMEGKREDVVRWVEDVAKLTTRDADDRLEDEMRAIETLDPIK